MAILIYYITIPFIYLLSLLPFPVLYLFSDFLYVILYRVLGYRKKVVLSNLRNSFPNKTEKEIQLICKQYYHYLCDLFLETFKTLTISKTNMLKHCYFNPASLDILNKLASENKNIILVLGHLGNWERIGFQFRQSASWQSRNI